MSGKSYPAYKPTGVDWLGEVPAEWGTKRLKRIVQLVDRKVETDEDQTLPYVGLEHIEPWGGRLLMTGDPLTTGVANRFSKGQVLFSKLRPYLAKAFIADHDGLCSTELLPLLPRFINERFLLYSLLSRGFVDLIDSSTYGSKMPRANWDFIGFQLMVLPSPSEQRQISDFLDRETAKIDELVAKKRELIERLREKRTALISHVVTKGLPPEEAAKHGLPVNLPLKPSGVPWLGNVPAHWLVLTFKRVCTRVFVGIAEAATHAYCQEGVPIIRSTNVKPNRLETEDVLHVEKWFAEQNRSKRLSFGDLLTVRTGYPGTTAVVPAQLDGAQCFTLVVSTPRTDTEPNYYAYLFNSSNGRSYFETEGWGTAQSNISVPIVQFMMVTQPPLAEQRAIVAYVEEKVSTLNSLIDRVHEVVEKLQEYRSALITAAVTGKIDVRDEVKS